MLHAVRRFLHWRRGVPALLYGTLRTLALAAPLDGFVREHDGQCVIAVFNLSDADATLSLARYGPLSPMPGSGFEHCLGGDGRLRPFRVLFAMLAHEPAHLKEMAA